MTLQKKVESQNKLIEIDGKNDTTKNNTPAGGTSLEARLEELEARPRRNPIVHWIAFALWMSTTKCLHTRQQPENP